MAPSSRGLGRRPLKAVTPVRIRSGLPTKCQAKGLVLVMSTTCVPRAHRARTISGSSVAYQYSAGRASLAGHASRVGMPTGRGITNLLAGIRSRTGQVIKSQETRAGRSGAAWRSTGYSLRHWERGAHRLPDPRSWAGHSDRSRLRVAPGGGVGGRRLPLFHPSSRGLRQRGALRQTRHWIVGSGPGTPFPPGARCRPGRRDR